MPAAGTEDATGTGTVLPRRAYLEQEWFDREQEDLFGRTWQFAGMAEDFAASTYRTVRAGAYPLVVTADGEGRLNAFHNLCRHRGATVAQGCGALPKAFVCPYHRWTYGRDGSLLNIPQRSEFAPGVELGGLGLRRARVETWRGMVFVHPDADPGSPAEPLADWLGDFPRHHGPYQPERLQEVVRESYDIRANWKTFAENHQDGYHLAYVHAANLRGYQHREQEHFLHGRHWSFFEPLIPGATPPDERFTRLRRIDHIDERWHGSSVHLLFPNLALAAGATFWATIHLLPVAPDRTTVELRVRGMPVPGVVLPALALLGRALPTLQLAAARGAAAARTVRAGVLDPREVVRAAAAVSPALGVMEEDVYCCEAIQEGLRSPGFELGPLAQRYERSVLAFQRNVLDYVPER